MFFWMHRLKFNDGVQNRYVEGAVESLLRTLKWANLDFDEGEALLLLGKDEADGLLQGPVEKVVLDLTSNLTGRIYTTNIFRS